MVDDAEYMRAQAMFFLGLARQMSDPKDQAHFKEKALRFTLKAEQLEERAQRLKQDTAVGRWKGDPA